MVVQKKIVNPTIEENTAGESEFYTDLMGTIDWAMLHSAIMFGGKTETHLSQSKFPGMKLDWHPKGVKVTYKDQVCVLPDAAFKAIYLSK